jgi:hypothetical protein
MVTRFVITIVFYIYIVMVEGELNRGAKKSEEGGNYLRNQEIDLREG